MHKFISKAAKAAGIVGGKDDRNSGQVAMSKNYPDNPRHRGCGYWAAFIGALEHLIQEAEERYLTVLAEKDQLHAENARLRDEIDKLRQSTMENGIELIAEQEGWDTDKRKQTVKRIAP